MPAALDGSPYQAYAYAYPHKTAYGPLSPARPLREVWSAEEKCALFLYLHVPFCEMRCGFCNLFTQSHSRAGLKLDLQSAYLAALERHASAVREALGPATFARVAIGGGTPTFLDVAGLERLFDIASRGMGAELGRVPLAIEASPFTATSDRLAILRARGATRLSIGVQSFFESETAAAGRAQKTAEVSAALDRIRAAGIPTLNIDLIYGIAGQTPATFVSSIQTALQWRPEELFLYPLYVRPLTTLSRRKRADDAEWDAQRLACYRAGRELLLSEGYRQLSMRHFRAAHAPVDDGPGYCCQDDGMVGLGCGSRSYTRRLHYSMEYAVSGGGIDAILSAYLAADAESFAAARHGFELNPDEERRRYVIKSLLRSEGLDCAAYRARFESDPLDDAPELREPGTAGLMEVDGARCVLTAEGLERSDAIGPWLASTPVRRRMEAYQWR